MDPVLRSTAIYIALLILFRLAGKRTLSQLTPFDFVLLLIIGEATQQGLLGDDFSVTNAILVVTTLIILDIAVSIAKQRSRRLDSFVEGHAVLLVDDGELLHDRLNRARIDEYDILEAARSSQGIDQLRDIRYAVLERSGGISIIPRS